MMVGGADLECFVYSTPGCDAQHRGAGALPAGAAGPVVGPLFSCARLGVRLKTRPMGKSRADLNLG